MISLLVVALSMLGAAVGCPTGSAPVARCVTENVGFGDFEPCYAYGFEVAPLSWAAWDEQERMVAFEWLPAQRDVLVTAVIVNDAELRVYEPFAWYWHFYEVEDEEGIETITWCGKQGWTLFVPVGR